MTDLRNVDSLSLEELCKPLSARVLPRSAYFTNDGEEKDAAHIAVSLSKDRHRSVTKKPFANKGRGA